MIAKYVGPLEIEKIVARVSLSDTRADVRSEFHLYNTDTRPLTVRLTATRLGLAQATVRMANQARLVSSLVPNSALVQLKTQHVPVELSAHEARILDVDFSDQVLGTQTKSFIFTPSLLADEHQVLTRVTEYQVTLMLPPNARRLVYSSIPPTRVLSTPTGLVCEFTQHGVYPLPISIKWTALEVNIAVDKEIKVSTNNWIVVTITLTNATSLPVEELVVEDSYTSGHVSDFRGVGLSRVRFNDKDERIIFRRQVGLAPRQQLTLSYEVRGVGSGVAVPITSVTKDSALVARSKMPTWIPLPSPPALPKTAFVLPAAWSFDYAQDGDHHLNEHGMWCTGMSYDERHEILNWTTSCIFADKSLDYDYNWSVAHQVIRVNPGYTYHGFTPWLARDAGTISVHNGRFEHAALKHFTKCIVLLQGWRFDFTSEDHHINNMGVSIATTGFNRETGEVTWRTSVSYADKNFDDDYRFQYWYIILAYNGECLLREYSGTAPSGGVSDKTEILTESVLRGYRSLLVIPIGWNFDYTSEDHHINQHDFRLTNVQYDSATGRVSWLAHFNFSDKNFDDPYSWRYRVALIASDDGASCEHRVGPFKDDGGLDTRSFSVNLNQLFTPVTWTNGIMDGDETGIDCGGSSPARCQNCLGSVEPGNGPSSELFSLADQDQCNVVRTFATVALLEYAQSKGQAIDTFYTGVEEADRYVEAVAWYVDQHMDYVPDKGSWSGAQSADRTLTESGHRGSKDFAGDCEDFAILRVALLRSLGFSPRCVFCADHHNAVDQGQCAECTSENKDSGGHTYNIVVYKGKYRILDYGPMSNRYWATCWDQHATNNIWNDHYGEQWSRQDVRPLGDYPLLNYPGNPCSPSSNWDWRTYYCDITP